MNSAPKKTNEAIKQPWEAPSSARRERLVENLTLTFVLIPLLAFVLMPLAWMILTAFKTQGGAFRVEFLPKTELFTPPLSAEPLPLATPPRGGALVHLEYEDTGATGVEVVYAIDGAEEKRISMQRLLDGVWAVDIPVTPAGATVAYAFIVGGGKDLPDPRTDTKDAEGLRSLLVANAPVSTNGAPKLLVVANEGNNALVRANIAAKHPVLLKVGSAEPMPIALNGETSVPVPADAGPTFRLVETRPFGEALDAMYTPDNFLFLLRSEDFDMWGSLLNSLIVAAGAGFLTVSICMLGGYAFATKQFHFREPLFKLLLASMMVPGMIYMVPQFSITLGLGWMDTYQGMIVPHLANVFGLFLMRQYISQIPKDLFAAAEVDGANEVQVFTNVVIPVCLPIMITLFLLTFVGQWSNFLWQLIVNTGASDVVTLPVALQQFKGQNANDWERIMAGACFSIVPIAVLFLASQKYFMQGLTAGAVKE